MAASAKHSVVKHRLTSASHSALEPRYLLKGLFFLLLLTTLWVFIIPGMVAHFDRVFYDEQVSKKMREPAFSAYKKFQQQQKDFNKIQERLVEKLKASALSNASGEEIHSLTSSLKEVSEMGKSLRPPVYPLGFTSDDSLIVFFVHFLFLGILYLLSACHNGGARLKSTILVGIAIYVIFGWPNLLRNFVFNKFSEFGGVQTRTVFASVHWDIDPAGFFLQEARILSMFLFVAVLWQLWMGHLRDITNKTTNWASSIKPEVFGERASLLSKEFSRWQSNSLLLVGAFLPWTWFFWRKYSVQGDGRYISTAVVMHIIWAISWLLLSLPIIHVLGRWSDFRLHSLNLVFAAGAEDTEAEKTLRLFTEDNPVDSLKIFGTWVAGIASMLLPLVHIFFKH